MAFLSEADLLHEDSGWTMVALPHTNHELPCDQQVREQWHELDQHQAVSCSSEPSDQLILWQQVVQQHPQFHVLNTQDWQELSSKAEDAEGPRCFMTAGGGVLDESDHLVSSATLLQDDRHHCQINCHLFCFVYPMEALMKAL